MSIFRLLVILLILGLNQFFLICYASVNEIAEHSLLSNIVKLPQGEFLRAGASQFGSLWTRDFCFSVPALLILNKREVVKNHLSYLIEHRRKDGLVPIYADSINPMKRVISETLNRTFGTHLNYEMTQELKPYYSVNGTFPTVDANILLLKAAHEYYKASGDEEWWISNQENFKAIYNYYKPNQDDGLLDQGEFSDWQDSASRKGKTLLTNLLYLDVSKNYNFLNNEQLKKLRTTIHEKFYDKDSGLYISVLGSKYISLDGILLAIDKKLLPNTDILYEKLKLHPLWNRYGTPGYATYPSYPKQWIISHVFYTGMSEYHGNLTWSWLMAYSSRVAYKQGDHAEAKRIALVLEEMILRDQCVGEIYFSNEEHEVYNSRFYKSESPFSWGAAYTIEMLNISKSF
jgi:glycogen debranching enzyme